MITASAFRAIESSLFAKLTEVLEPITTALYAKVEDALAKGDFDHALQEFNTLNLTTLREELQGYIEYITSVAMLFGASRVTQQPGTSVVGLGYEALATKQMSNLFLTAVTLKAELYLKEVGKTFILGQAAVQQANDQPVAKADSVLQPFSSFMKGAGKAYLNITSSLHTSRVSAYGFTAEADALGLEEYQLNEQLDNRVCPICRVLHGKVFKVKDARALLNVATRVTDPDELKALHPWPPQTVAGLEAIKKMTNAELVQASWFVPPFHPGCRGLLARVGKSPPLKDVLAGTVPERYEATEADFESLDVPASKEQVSLWNRAVGMSPVEAVARLSGAPLDTLLEALLDPADKTTRKGLGIKQFSIRQTIALHLKNAGFGASKPFDKRITIYPKHNVMSSGAVEVPLSDALRGVASDYLVELYMLAKDIGASRLEVVSGGAFLGVELVRYGFLPSVEAWKALRDFIISLVGYEEASNDNAILRRAMSSEDPAMIRQLLGVSFFEQALIKFPWEGGLSLSDPESIALFLAYLQRVRSR